MHAPRDDVAEHPAIAAARDERTARAPRTRAAHETAAPPGTNAAVRPDAAPRATSALSDDVDQGARGARRIDGPGGTDVRRPAWRQQLVEAERGMALGLRGGSALFVHFFAGSVIAAAGLVLGLDLLEWAIVSLACSGVVALELFHAMLRTLAFRMGPDAAEETRAALRIGTAAVFVAIVGCLTTVGLVLGRHLGDLTPPGP